MRIFLDRYFVIPVLLGAAAFVVSTPGLRGRSLPPKPQSSNVSSEHDFDFLLGSWTVQHRRLKHRLAHSSEWETFSGTCHTWRVLGGQADIDDNFLQAPAGSYRAVTMRSFDPATKTWAIWWLDSRYPHHLDPPVVGKFQDGVGTFFANDTFNGRAVVVRFIWSEITPESAKWQQAFSEDGGKTWETNWVMEFHRVAEPQS